MQFPHRLLLEEYADALNRGDRGWLEYLFDPGVRFSMPDRPAPVSGRTAVAEQLARKHSATVRAVGRLGEEPVIVVWESDGRPIYVERLESGPNGIVSVGVQPLGETTPGHLQVERPSFKTRAPESATPARVMIRTVRSQLAIGLHQSGPYFDCVVDPCLQSVERWLALNDIAPAGPYSTLFDDVSRYRDGEAPFTVVIPIEGSLAHLPRAARSLAVVHPWLGPNSWRGPRGEISVLAMPATSVASVLRPAHVSTGEFMRTLNAARRAVTLEGRMAGWPIREIYHGTGADPLPEKGREPDWEIHIPMI